MKKLLDPEGKLYAIIGVVGDHLLLSIVWLVCLIPVVTVGAASAAMCQMSFRIVRGEDYRLLADYFRAFKEHFKRATLLWLGILAIGALLVLDGYFYVQIAAANGDLATLVLGMLGMVTVLYASCLIWAGPYLCHYEGGFLQAVKMIFMLALSRFGWTVLMLAADVALLALGLYAPFLIPFLPGIITLVNTLCIRFALRKYIEKDESDKQDGENAENP